MQVVSVDYVSTDDFDSSNLTTLKFSVVKNFYDLSFLIKVKPSIISYYYKFRNDKQKLIKIKDRCTYNSAIGLKRIQMNMLKNIFEPIINQIPNEHMLAYIKGRQYVKTLCDSCVGNDYMITYDIKKYYDSITKKHIVDTLMDYGFTKKGAKLVAHYCVVKRTVTGKDGKERIVETLQQGSPCSPAIANIVGYKYIDTPVLDYLKNKFNSDEFKYKYVRFSDNVGLFISGPVTKEMIQDYIKFTKDTLSKSYFRFHDVCSIKITHPKIHQKFLGVVLNKIARVELNTFKRLRAILFNCARHGVVREAKTYFLREYGSELPGFTQNTILIGDNDIVKKFYQHMTGKIAYIKQINEKQYRELHNLLEGVKLLNNERDLIYYSTPSITKDSLPGCIFDIVKKYSNLGTEEYLNRVQQAIQKYIQLLVFS
jgi:hypothetical protein